MKISYEKFNTNLKNCFGCMLYSGSHAKYLPNMLHRCLYDGCESIVESAGQGSEWTTYPCAIRTCPIQVKEIAENDKRCGNCKWCGILQSFNDDSPAPYCYKKRIDIDYTDAACSKWEIHPHANIQVSVQDDIQDNKTCGNCRFISITTPNGSETYRCFISPCVIHHVKQPGCKLLRRRNDKQ